MWRSLFALTLGLWLETAIPAFAQTVVLHNSLDASSRAFVNSIPSSANVRIIDWYKDDVGRYSYTGPPPSAFPTVILDMGNGTQGTLRQPANWESAQAAIASPSGKAESTAIPNTYIGGQTVPETQALINTHRLTSSAESTLRATQAAIAMPAAQATIKKIRAKLAEEKLARRPLDPKTVSARGKQ